MEKMCDWCGKGTNNLTRVNVNESFVELCKDCLDCNENHVCITCKEPLYGGISIQGECLGCMQIRSAQTEKRRSDALNGMGVDFIRQMVESSTITDKDYYEWMAMGNGTYTQENCRVFRMAWIKEKIVGINHWTAEEFEENYPDIEFIMNNNSSMVFREPCKFVLLSGKEKVKSGSVALARKGRVLLVEA